jgi:hypothetical protein
MKLFLGRNVTFITINVVNIIFLSTGKQRRLPSFDKLTKRHYNAILRNQTIGIMFIRLPYKVLNPTSEKQQIPIL